MASSYYDSGMSNVTDAANSGKDAINSFDPNAIANNTQSGFDSLFGNQQGQQKDYIQQYKDSIAANPSVQSLYNSANDQFNVPTLQNNATQLQNAVLQTPNNVLNAAKGFNFDNNQVQNQTNMMLTRLSPLASAATNAANTASGLAQGAVNAGIQQNQMNLLPVQEQGQMMSDLWARQASGYTTAAQQRFDGLNAKMQSGVQLSQAEMAEFSKLAQSEMSYQGTLAQANAQLKAAQINNQYQQVPYGSNLVNTFTNSAMNPGMLTSKTGVATYGR